MNTLLKALGYLNEMAPVLAAVHKGEVWRDPAMSNIKRDKAKKAKKLAKLRRKQGRH